MKRSKNKIMIAFNATREEAHKFDVVKLALKRSTRSDLIRYLVEKEHEKIFSQSVPTGTERT